MRMTTRNPKASDHFGIVVAIAGILLAAVLLPSATFAAPDNLPPRPTPLTPPAMPPRPTPATPPPMPPRPGATPVPSPLSRWRDGGAIELRTEFTDKMIWTVLHWQDPWTVVQWQDHSGEWHDVEGWQGTFDEFSENVGRKTWWVAKLDLAKGPFRWMVYRSKGGRLLGQSLEFYLPTFVGERVVVEVMCGL